MGKVTATDMWCILPVVQQVIGAVGFISGSVKCLWHVTASAFYALKTSNSVAKETTLAEKARDGRLKFIIDPQRSSKVDILEKVEDKEVTEKVKQHIDETKNLNERTRKYNKAPIKSLSDLSLDKPTDYTLVAQSMLGGGRPTVNVGLDHPERYAIADGVVWKNIGPDHPVIQQVSNVALKNLQSAGSDLKLIGVSIIRMIPIVGTLYSLCMCGIEASTLPPGV